MALPADKHYTAHVLERRELSEDLWLVKVDPGGPFPFKAGQYATLGVDNGENASSAPTRSSPRHTKRASSSSSSNSFRKASSRLSFTNYKKATSSTAAR